MRPNPNPNPNPSTELNRTAAAPDYNGDASSTWALRSEVNAAGDGGVTCSACVPSVAVGQGAGSRMLITGGKDSVLREWEIAEGRPRLVAEISGWVGWFGMVWCGVKF